MRRYRDGFPGFSFSLTRSLGILGLALAVSSCSLGIKVVLVDQVPQTESDDDDDATVSSSPSCPGGPTTFSTNMNARYVIGQANMTANSANRGGAAAANTLKDPLGVVVRDDKLYVADGGNNRVLVYNTLPTSDGVAADGVIGQPDFTTTASGTTASTLSGIQMIATDGTYLAVAEWGNHRVSFWPLAAPTAASQFWGQINGTSNSTGLNDHAFNAPAGLAYAGGKFYVGEAGNNRVLTFDGSAISTNQSAQYVTGQLNMTSNSTGAGNTELGQVYSVSSDGTNLVAMDNFNDRIMIFNTLPTSNGAAADVVWGGYGITATGLNNPVGVFVGDGKLFIADRGSDRVLVFNSIPTSASQVPDAVLGQATFLSQDHNQCNCATAAANTLWGVHHVYWDGCRLYVSDKQNHRVLVY